MLLFDLFLYSMEFDDFEAGEIIATRHYPRLAVSGDWVCYARNDAEAMSKASIAALTEWAAPENRDPLALQFDFRCSPRWCRDMAERIEAEELEGVESVEVRNPETDNESVEISLKDGRLLSLWWDEQGLNEIGWCYTISVGDERLSEGTLESTREFYGLAGILCDPRCRGWAHFNVNEPTEHIERCDSCDMFSNDEQAAAAHAEHCSCMATADSGCQRCHRCGDQFSRFELIVLVNDRAYCDGCSTKVSR